MSTFKQKAKELFERRQFVRRNFGTTVLGGSDQKRRKEFGALAQEGYLRRHNPRDFKTYPYPVHFFRIYSAKHRHLNINPHQIFTDDLALSFEASANLNDFAYKDRADLIGHKPLSISANIEHTFPPTKFKKQHTEPYDKPLRPDELFGIAHLPVVLEGDLGSETHEPDTFENKKSTLRSLLQYRDVLINRTYQREWGLKNLIVLLAFTSDARMRHAMETMENLGGESRAIIFGAFPTLVSTTTAPEPLVDILEYPFKRVGYEDFIFTHELKKDPPHGRQADTDQGAHRNQGEDRPGA
jgi:hypothetical protein